MLHRKKIFYIALPVLSGYLALMISGAGANYEKLFMLPFSIPIWLFGIMWIFMYFIMGMAAYKSNRYLCNRIGNTFYYTQLFLSFLWLIILFGFDFKIAFAIIILALGFTLSTMREFYHLDRTAGYLLLPYILWLIYMAILNFSICVN